MKTYGLYVPITGYVAVEVEAGTEEEAIQKALESDVSLEDVEEWEMHRTVVEGNFFHGLRNTYEVYYVDDNEEE